MALKGKRLGLGAGAFGGAGRFGVFALGVFSSALVLLLATAIEAWLAALVVAGIYTAIAGVLALTGKRKAEQAMPPVPEQAIESTKTDLSEAKRPAQVARQ
jgi:nitrate/nitrite transporter NarK